MLRLHNLLVFISMFDKKSTSDAMHETTTATTTTTPTTSAISASTPVELTSVNQEFSTELTPTTQLPATTSGQSGLYTSEPLTSTVQLTSETSGLRPVTACGSIMHVAPPGTPFKPGWDKQCFISRQNDSVHVPTQCRDLIQNLPPDIGDYQELLARGGNFGCHISLTQNFTTAAEACFDNYQHNVTMLAVPTSQLVIVCIRMPISDTQEVQMNRKRV